jgi:hypothetical protein
MANQKDEGTSDARLPTLRRATTRRPRYIRVKLIRSGGPHTFFKSGDVARWRSVVFQIKGSVWKLVKGVDGGGKMSLDEGNSSLILRSRRR